MPEKNWGGTGEAKRVKSRRLSLLIMTHKRDLRERLFKKINANLRKHNPSIGDKIVCPLCWKSFGIDSIDSGLSVEDVPPIATADLIKEKVYKTLTCKDCNSKKGYKYDSDLKNFLVNQLQLSGKYEEPVKGSFSWTGNGATPLQSKSLFSNIVLTSHSLSVTEVPQTNNPSVTRESHSIRDGIASDHPTEWSFTVTNRDGFRPSAVWLAYLHAAYLMIYIFRGCHYAFTEAGMELRKIITGESLSQTGPCVITPQAIGVGGKPWVAKVTRPDNLRCLWVKVAGNIVIVPLPEDRGLSCYRAWQEVSEQNKFYSLSPRKMDLSIVFCSPEDRLEAQKVLSNGV